jgi:histidinol-phosphate phosphatase family protein
MPRNNSGAVFLDRDGVINHPPSEARRYIRSWKEFRFIPGTLRALRKLHEAKKRVIVVSNQAGVGKKIMTQKQLDELTQRMRTTVEKSGGKLHAVYYCTHTPSAECGCRKPRTGMLKKARRKFGIDLGRSIVVGDSPSDILMGQLAGCATVMVLSGKTNCRVASHMAHPAHYLAKNLDQAVQWILENHE